MTRDITDQPLDKKFRPTDFDEVIGNESTIESIKMLLARDQEFPPCILLFGPSGCGKTTIARIIATHLEAGERDIKEYNIGDMRGIDTGRDIIKLTAISPFSKSRVIILDECHKATAEFQNVLLKTFEEPRPNNYFILCTTEKERLIKTIQTRCTKYQVNLLSTREMKKLLSDVIGAEGMENNISPTVIDALIDVSDGSPREALVTLDSIIDLDNEKRMLEVIGSGSQKRAVTIDLCRAIMAKKNWKDIAAILKELETEEAESARRIILKYFETVILNGGKQADRVVALMDFFTEPMYASGRPGLTQACYLALKV